MYISYNFFLYSLFSDSNLIQRIKEDVRVRMSAEWPGWIAARAIDGNNSTAPGCDCCSLAYSGDQMLWWEIDLGMMYPIKLIQFFGEDYGKEFTIDLVM